MDEIEYESLKKIFYSDRNNFYATVLRKKNFRLCFLYLYSKMALDLLGKFREHSISDTIFFDTFSDLTLWCETCFSMYREYGIDEYMWIAKHLDFKLFKLGILQFEREPERSEFIAFIDKKMLNKAIMIHIPRGEALELKKVKESITMAYHFFGKEALFLCHSWLLSPKLKKVLAEDTNIMSFQKLFELIHFDEKNENYLRHVFGYKHQDISQYPENTSLQKKLKQRILMGDNLGSALCLFKGLDYINH